MKVEILSPIIFILMEFFGSYRDGKRLVGNYFVASQYHRNSKLIGGNSLLLRRERISHHNPIVLDYVKD